MTMVKKTNSNKFQLRFDKNGNLCSLISNGVIALTIKLNNEEKSYTIKDVKTGLSLITKRFNTVKTMRKYMRQDIATILNTYTSTEQYDLMFTQKINPNRRF